MERTNYEDIRAEREVLVSAQANYGRASEALAVARAHYQDHPFAQEASAAFVCATVDQQTAGLYVRALVAAANYPLKRALVNFTKANAELLIARENFIRAYYKLAAANTVLPEEYKSVSTAR